MMTHTFTGAELEKLAITVERKILEAEIVEVHDAIDYYLRKLSPSSYSSDPYRREKMEHFRDLKCLAKLIGDLGVKKETLRALS